MLFAGCTEDATTPTTKIKDITLEEGYMWYGDDEYDFKIAYPENWDIDYASGVSFHSDTLKPYFNISELEMLGISEEDNPKLPEAYVYVHVQSDPEKAKWWEYQHDTKILDSGNVTINGREGYQLIFDIDGYGEPTSRTVVFTVNDLYYTITAFSISDSYKENEDIFENIINSFIIME